MSFTQAELDQIFELLEEFEEMPILFSDETLAYIMLGISWYIYTFYTYGMWMFGECPAFWRCVFAQPHSILAAWAATLQVFCCNDDPIFRHLIQTHLGKPRLGSYS